MPEVTKFVTHKVAKIDSKENIYINTLQETEIIDLNTYIKPCNDAGNALYANFNNCELSKK